MPAPVRPKDPASHIATLAKMVAQIQADAGLKPAESERIVRSLSAAIAVLQPLVGRREKRR